GINVSGSTVTLGTNTAAGVSGIALNNGATLAAGVSGLVVANNIVTTGSGLINQGSGVMTLNGVIGGVGSISTVGTGELVLNGNNAFTGGLGINVSGSTVTLGTNTAAGVSGIALNNGATLKAGAAGLVVANTVITTGAGTIDTQAQTFTLAGPIGGAGSIAKVGTGNLVLTGASTYTGATNVNAGTLSVNGSLGNTAVTVASGATLGGTGSIAGTVTVANGGILAPGNSVGTLSVGALNLNAASVLNWDLGQAYAVGGVYNDLVKVTGNLVLDGLLNVTNSNSFGLGVYQLGTYGGTLTNNGLTINSLPSPYTGTIQTAIAGQVNLLVAGPGVLTQYWDGGDTVGNGTIDGGNGTWSVAGTNWTGPAPSGINTNWQGGIAVFAGAAGTVTLDAPASFVGLQFATTGYTIGATGTGGLTNASGAFVYANTGISATINAVISGAGALDKQGVGTVTLNAANTYTGGTTITDGTLGVGNNAALSTGTLTMSNSAILQAATSGLVLTNNIIISPATGARVDSGSGTFTLNGNISGATGSLSQIGTGNLVLGGNNSFGAGLGIN
ncbi:transporter, partial [Polymorphobacter arshaanensis]